MEVVKLQDYSPVRTETLVDSQPDVASLVAAARAGDRSAFVALHSRYAPMVHAIVLSRAPTEEADDLVQEVFVEAIEGLDKLRRDRSFGPWIARIARNRTARLLERRLNLVALPTNLPARSAPTVEAMEVLEKIRQLPETYRETLLMRLVEGMTGPEIAEKTGMKPGSVRVNLHRGMQMLRDLLGARRTG